MSEPPKRNRSPSIDIVESLTAAQIEQLHSLMRDQWWGTERTLDDVRTMLANTSLSLAAINRESGRLVGYCRVLTDFVFRATIYDVMVRDDHQKIGLGSQMMQVLSDHPKLQGVSLIYLACEPALEPFYQRFGFREYEARTGWMMKIQHPENGVGG